VSALDLRLVVITDRTLAAPAIVSDVIAAALAAGAPAVQLRDKNATARELFDQAVALLPVVCAHGARLFINDRMDVAIAARAHGVHLGPGDLPVAAARRAVPTGFLIGFSTDDPERARNAQRDGADYIGCGAVFGTTSKRDVAGERIGTAQLDRVARAVTIPVIGIGGIDASNVADVAATHAVGAAVIGAVMGSADPASAVRALLAAFR
jgi:thiamine-phosphate pyrophosphorylase